MNFVLTAQLWEERGVYLPLYDQACDNIKIVACWKFFKITLWIIWAVPYISEGGAFLLGASWILA